MHVTENMRDFRSDCPVALRAGQANANSSHTTSQQSVQVNRFNTDNDNDNENDAHKTPHPRNTLHESMG